MLECNVDGSHITSGFITWLFVPRHALQAMSETTISRLQEAKINLHSKLCVQC